MRVTPIALAALPLGAQAANIVLSNDDGWAEKNIRTFYDTLTAAGNSVVLSAPAENQSGSGSSTETPSALTQPCEFNSCPAGSPATGADKTNGRLNYVNAYPVDAIKYGIQTVAPKYFGGAKPDLAVTGPNVGSNLGLTTLISGTVGAAVEAINEGIPAIAFSGASGSATAYTAATPLYAAVYADAATQITQALLASGKPYLPSGIFLNVNFPAVSSSKCSSASQFKYVFSRVNTAILAANDVTTCGSSRLPTESSVVGTTSGCYVSISVADTTKTTANAAAQAAVLPKLKSILSCLP